MVILIILGILAYIAIGGFIAGLVDDYEMEWFLVCLWPIALVIMLFCLIALVPKELAYSFKNAVKEYMKEKEKKDA